MRKPLFLFGTLLHAPLYTCVAGRAPVYTPADLPGHAVRAVKDQAFPILVGEAGSVAQGVIVREDDPEAMARLDFYETIFAYTRHDITVLVSGEEVEADVYLPPEGQWEPGDLWSLEQWQEDHGALNCAAAEELMERRETTAPETLAALYPVIRARAWSRLLAQETPGPTELRRKTKADDVAVVPRADGYDGFFRHRTFDIQSRRFDGTRGPALFRETFVAYDAALVLPYDPASDQVLLVEQLRFSAVWRGDPELFMLEPIAGLVDAGEQPEAAARREAEEEAGLTLNELLPIHRGYPAPGYVTEYHHMFLGLCQLDEGAGGLGGLASESEDIRSHVIEFDRAMALVESGEITATPLILMLLWLQRERSTLRARSV